MKCPACQEGPFFTGSIYSFKHLGEPKDKCDKCGTNFSPETGFYYGAMYVSYGLGVALFVSIWVFFSLFIPDYNPITLVLTICIAFLLLFPYLYALSKIIWAHIFIHKKTNDRTAS